jgi:protein TonB
MFKTLGVVLALATMCPLLEGQAAYAPVQTDKSVPQQQPEKVRHVGGSVKPPTVISGAAPVPDGSAHKAGQKPKFEGNVQLYLIVDKDGNATHVQVARSCSRKDLDATAVDAVSHYKFKPATEHGKPVAVDLYIGVNFQIF